MKVIFSHGLESGPWGTKIQRMAAVAQQLGFDVDSIDYTDTKVPEQRAQRLADILKTHADEQIILVGSSMGGYVSLAAAESQAPKAMFLLAPAIYLPGYPDHPKGLATGDTEIIHGWQDEIIPVEHSIRFAGEHRCTLHLVDGDHRLIDVLDYVVELFEQFLLRQKI